MAATSQSIKQMAHAAIDRLPETASLKDVAYEMTVLQDLVDGLQDSADNRVTANNDVRKQFGLSELIE